MLLLTATAIVLAIAVAVLIAPIGVDLRIVKRADEPALDIRTEIRWLGLRVPLPSTAPARRGRRPPRARRQSSASAGQMRAFLLSPGLIGRAGRLLTELAGIARPRRVELYVRVGFEDPSDTGAFLGWLYFQVAGSRDPIRFEPDFSGEVLAGSLRLRWSRSIWSLAWPIVKFISSPIVWRAVRNYRASRSASALA